jgi:2-aminoadipate transaminase
MLLGIDIDAQSDVPLYRQVYEHIRGMIASGALNRGDRLPATRELAGSLGLNRTTVSAAYALLEADGLIQGHVGRGSFVLAEPQAADSSLDWERLLPPSETLSAPTPPHDAISFAVSRPAEDLFPVKEFRRSCEEVLGSPEAGAILQLGSPGGYAPLRHHLLEEARREGVARATDDLTVTNGCQQALDLIARILVRPGDAVLVEDPVYTGLKNVLVRAGAQLIGVPVGHEGIEVDALERALARSHARLIVVTPNFQNPTGATIPLATRRAILRLARAAGAVLVENDTYGELRYEGEPVPPIKQLDAAGDTVLLRSFSKLTFPGLRVGWVVGPHALMARLAEAKRLADLHTDQLSQAVLLRFAVSGRLAAHRAHVLEAGRERLGATLDACQRFLPNGTSFTRPEGGMNLWVRLPEPLDAGELLDRAQRAGVTYLPGKYFAVTRHDAGALRLSFADLTPEKIRKGLATLGEIFSSELARARLERSEPAPAMV